METILNEIDKALKAELPYLAIMLALTVPDICSALESETGKSSGEKYKAWYRAHLAKYYPQMTAEDCYSLRCGVVHEGRFGHAHMQYDRIGFFVPDPNIKIAGIQFASMLTLDGETFCQNVIRAVREWLQTKTADQNVQANLPRLFQYRPNGYPPAGVRGIALIA